MRFFKYLISPSATILAAVLAAPAAAQDAEEELQEHIIPMPRMPETYITVLATGEREQLAFTGVAVSVFDVADIRATQGPDLVRLLERAPGVTLSRNGGVGGFTALRVRGAEADQLLVLVDGVRLNDPAAPASGFDLGTLGLGSIDKVELQRSANSTIWGSQAMGGVLAVSSDLVRGTAGSLELGSYESLYATAATAQSVGPLAINLSGGWRQSQGFSTAAVGIEKDSHRQGDLSARVEARLTDELKLFARARFADARLDLDGFPFPYTTVTDTDEYQDTRQLSGVAGAELEIDNLNLRASYAEADTERQSYDFAFGTAPGYAADGTSRRAELRGNLALTDELRVYFGGEREWLAFSSLYDARQETAIWGGHAQINYDADELHLAVGMRRDEHRQFGGEWSLGADAAYELTNDLRVTASYGEGFKAPSLFQLLSDYGNAALRPERARSYDAGIAWDNGPLELTLTAFRRDTRDQIVFDSCFMTATGICAGRPNGTYDNRAQTRAQGIEAEAEWRVARDVWLSAVYALIDAEDRTAGSFTLGNALARRPRHAATMSASASPRGGVTVAADLRLVSKAFDNASNTVQLDSYAVATLRGSWDISDNIQLYARIENLGDEDYQTAAGYAQSGRSAYVGARLRL